jgi:hypothetical protein
MMSSPRKTAGMAFSWMGVGTVKPSLLIPLFRRESRLKVEKFTISFSSGVRRSIYDEALLTGENGCDC